METANLHHWVIEGQRNPHLGVFQQASSVRRNAHNRVTPAVERQSLAGDRQDSAETPSPQTLADHCHPRQAELLFFRREGTALNRLDTEGSKEIGGDVRGDDPFRLGVAGQVVRTRHHRRKLFKGGILSAVVEEIGRRGGGMISLTELSPHPDDSLRVLERQRPQDNRIDYTEDRGIRAYSERKGQHRNSRKARMLEQHPDAISQVLPQCFHHSIHLSTSLLYPKRQYPKRRSRLRRSATDRTHSQRSATMGS